jgi:hypothetical protein
MCLFLDIARQGAEALLSSAAATSTAKFSANDERGAYAQV